MSNMLSVPNTSDLGQSGVDEVITDIQRELSRLPWLQNSFGRVYPKLNDKGGLEPWIYKGKSEYYLAYPNDTLSSFSCLYAHDDESFVDDEGIFGKRTLSVIVWLNLKAMKAEGPTVEPYKQEVIRKIRELYCVLSVNKSFDQTANGPTAVYPNFDVSGIKLQYLTYPYGGFRVEMTVHYTNLNNC